MPRPDSVTIADHDAGGRARQRNGERILGAFHHGIDDVAQGDMSRGSTCAAPPPGNRRACRQVRQAARCSRNTSPQAKSCIGMNRCPRSAHHDAQARQFGARHAVDAAALGLEMNRSKTSHVVKDRRDDRPDHNLPVRHTPRNSAMTKAAAPIIGGMICPPVEAVASTPAAKCGGKPERFISGIEIGTIDHNVGNCAAGDGAEQTRGDDRHLPRAARAMAGQGSLRNP